ncbi:protein O-mannosyl-transferase TMTC4-like [Crassostrea angulata]|uniref:protein O-mannosyl-transferase TMTC4-like n=1 Tax=Magallana angulata TaxID=2784310 RepID=UPI0022B0F8D4|nr:protein O-mannosyl-transferase TMTC4-like [Crassostrea angulata]XP_052702665.1 protein O-mannosyl-transferase TMTC4-like [Crassostrea angulata]
MNRLRQNGHTSSKLNGYHKSDVPYRKEWDSCLPLPSLFFTPAAGVVFVFAVACFMNSYQGDFVFDDSEAILSNNDLKPETPLSDLFVHDFWGSKLDSKTSHKSYRPLTVLTFRWNYFLSGGPYPMSFHIVNIILHGLVSVLMLAVFSLVLAGYHNDREGRPLFGAPKASLACAILFAIHPIHTESVAGIVGRADLLCALLFILSFLCYVRSCCQDTVSRTHATLHRPETFSLAWFCLSVVFCGLSVLCKEQGITVIGICSAYDIIVICQVDVLRLLRLKKSTENQNQEASPSVTKQNTSGDWFKSLCVRHLFLAITGAAILVTRWRVMGSAPPVFQVFDNPHSFVNGTLLRTLNYNYLYALNCWILVNPWWLCFDWSMGSVPTIDSLSDPRVLAVIVLWVVLAFCLYSACVGPIGQQQRQLTMALALLIVPFLPASNLFFRVGFVIAERVLYLSTAGFCILVVMGICKLQQKFTSMNTRYCLFFLVAVFMIRSIQRSNEWKTEMALFTAGAKTCPLNAKVHYNIGKLNSDLGNIEKAISKYRLAISLNPEYDQAMNNLGNLLKDQGKNEEAEQLLRKAVEIRPDFAAAWMNLGIVQAALKKPREAEQSYHEALRHRRKYPDCYYNLGNLYLDMGQHQMALNAWRNATLLKPKHLNAWSNMVILLDNIEKLEQAEMVGKEAVKLFPNDPTPYFNLANVMGKADRYKESEQYFLKAIQLSGNSPVAKMYANLGVLYHRWDKPAEAERAYMKALELDPSSHNVQQNLQMLRRKYSKNAKS